MELSEDTNGIEVDITQLIGVLLRKAWIIILSGIVLATVAYMLSQYVMTEMYQSITKIYVMSKQDDAAVTYTDMQTSSQLTNDYKMLVTSRPVIENVIDELGLDIEYNNLANMISVSNPSNTRILIINVKYTDPVMAQKIADSIRDASSVHISNVMKIDEVSVVEYANLAKEPSSPNVFRNTIIGGILGVILSAMVVALLYMLDDTIKTPDDIEKYLNISVLGTIPLQKELVKPDKKKKNKKHKKHNKGTDKRVIAYGNR